MTGQGETDAQQDTIGHRRRRQAMPPRPPANPPPSTTATLHPAICASSPCSNQAARPAPQGMIVRFCMWACMSVRPAAKQKVHKSNTVDQGLGRPFPSPSFCSLCSSVLPQLPRLAIIRPSEERRRGGGGADRRTDGQHALRCAAASQQEVKLLTQYVRTYVQYTHRPSPTSSPAASRRARRPAGRRRGYGTSVYYKTLPTPPSTAQYLPPQAVRTPPQPHHPQRLCVARRPSVARGTALYSHPLGG